VTSVSGSRRNIWFMDKNNIVIIEIWEGLGNQLFQYAYGRMLKEKGVDVRLDLGKTYDQYMDQYKNNTPRQIGIQNFNVSLPGIDVEKYGKYDYIKRNGIRNRIVFHLARHGLWRYKFYEEPLSQPVHKMPHLKGNYYVKAWFQSEQYIRSIRGILLKEFTPKKRIQISKKLRQALGYNETVSLHVRRGDYITTGKVLPKTYYRKAVRLMGKQYKDPLFLVFSEDLDWVKRNLDIGECCLYVNENRTMQDYEELLIMSKCSSNIISNSTFSWWGAWLNRNPEKTVVAPQYQWSPKQVNMIPNDWITLTF